MRSPARETSGFVRRPSWALESGPSVVPHFHRPSPTARGRAPLVRRGAQNSCASSAMPFVTW
jgi:hypothetical protein